MIDARALDTPCCHHLDQPSITLINELNYDISVSPPEGSFERRVPSSSQLLSSVELLTESVSQLPQTKWHVTCLKVAAADSCKSEMPVSQVFSAGA